MKVTVTQERLAKALNYVSKIIGTTVSLPILSNVLLSFEKGEVYLSTTDLEIGIRTRIDADVKTEGKTTVDARTFSEFVNSLSQGSIDIELKEKRLIVSNDKNSADFHTVEADEFPPLPKKTKTSKFETKALDFSHALSQVAVSSAKDNTRPVLTGLLFCLSKKGLTLVGVDGFRLSKKEMKVKADVKEKTTYIVPTRALMELSRIAMDICDKDDEVKVYVLDSKNQMLFIVNDVEVSTRLIEGEFPEYQQILPSEHSYKFTVDKESLTQTVKVVNIFARSAVGNKASFEMKKDSSVLELAAQVADVGKNNSSVEIYDVEGEDLKTAFNTRFLSDMLNSMPGEEIIFETNGSTAPGVFKDKGDESFLHIIMPMRLD